MITVFTPTFNRAYKLSELYKSLQRQTYKNFEWLIIDDGSTDNTEHLFNKWKNETNSFRITYIKQKNGGKHRAINKGVQLAKGKLFFIVDSDDFLAAFALQRIQEVYEPISENELFAGVSGMKAYTNNKRVGGTLPFKQIDCSMIDVRTKYHIKGDMAEVFKTEILRQYPFQEFDGENFISEGVVWSKISQKYILRYFCDNIYFCEYLPDGLTHSIAKRFRQNPQGSMYAFMQIINSPKHNIKIKIKTAVKYWRAVPFYKEEKTKEMKPKIWQYLFWPFGLIIYFYDLIRK